MSRNPFQLINQNSKRPFTSFSMSDTDVMDEPDSDSTRIVRLVTDDALPERMVKFDGPSTSKARHGEPRNKSHVERHLQSKVKRRLYCTTFRLAKPQRKVSQKRPGLLLTKSRGMSEGEGTERFARSMETLNQISTKTTATSPE